jgi:hypothetical protein
MWRSCSRRATLSRVKQVRLLVSPFTFLFFSFSFFFKRSFRLFRCPVLPNGYQMGNRNLLNFKTQNQKLYYNFLIQFKNILSCRGNTNARLHVDPRHDRNPVLLSREGHPTQGRTGETSCLTIYYFFF